MGERIRRRRPGPRAAQAVTRPVLFDASFLIQIERESAARQMGPARTLLASLRGRRAVISVVTVAEVLEGADDQTTALESLLRFTIHGLQLAQAGRCALLQLRAPHRLGENDAWIVATAQTLDADVVGADRPAFERLGDRYLRFR